MRSVATLYIENIARAAGHELREDGTLIHDPVVKQVLRAAEFVIDPQIRYGVLNASS